MKCDHLHLFLILCLQFLRHTKHTHPHTYACCHARFHDSWPPFCLKVFIYAKLHKLLCDVTGRHFRRLSRPRPLWVRGWLKQPLAGEEARCVTSPNDGCEGDSSVSGPRTIKGKLPTHECDRKCLQSLTNLVSKCAKFILDFETGVVLWVNSLCDEISSLVFRRVKHCSNFPCKHPKTRAYFFPIDPK